VEDTMLNEKQQHAVDCNDRFIFLYAGAGTGKTTVMISRIQKLLETNVLPASILGLTFTNKAAKHMQEKLNRDDISLKTFHAWAYMFVSKTLIPSDIPFSKDVIKRISDYKNKHMTSKLPKMFKAYIVYLKTHNYIDYDDLLIEAIKNHGFNQRYDHILIDEFQDTNMLQLKLLETLIKEKTHVFAVGDPDQSIYKFRGAVPNIVSRFIKSLNATTLTLDINYRCDYSIIDHANHILTFNSNRFKKSLIAHAKSKGELRLLKHLNVLDEAIFIISFIKSYRSQSILITARTHDRLYEIKHVLFYSYHHYHKERIEILTMHQAKGLEFDIVMILGLENGVLPYGKYLNKETIEEERRLFYVGVTRARHLLMLSYVENDGLKKCKPSHFLHEFISTSNKKGQKMV
jgi:DNA helicase-2/ATP-dependent DNA helicase PcrA